MGNLEKRTQEKAKRLKIQESITLALFRITAHKGRFMFAKESYVRKHLNLPDNAGRDPSHRMRQAMQRLQKRGLLEWKKDDTGWKSRLTEKGEKFAERIEKAERITIRPPKLWDEKWRVVIFDVKEKYKSSRDRFRRILTKAGLLRLQDSVWIHPYDCEELVSLIRKELKLGGSVLYLIVEGIESNSKLRQHFKL